MVETLKEILAKFDSVSDPIEELDVFRALESIGDTNSTTELPMEWIAEMMAFRFYEGHSGKGTVWGTYFGPMAVFKNQDGQYVENPSITKVTQSIIEYWVERASSARNPVLRARYADLVWDFSHKTIGKRPDYKMAQIAIDSYVEISQTEAHKRPVNVKRKLERALSLALSLKDNSRIIKVRDALIRYEDSIAGDSKLGLWGFSYDALIDKNRVPLTEDLQKKIIQDLEGHLDRACQPPQGKEIDPWAAEASALRLAKYYRKTRQQDAIKRVLLKYGEAFIHASAAANALQASAWLQRVHSNYIEYGLINEAEIIALKLRSLGTKARSELKSVSHTIEIDRQKMDEYIAALTEGTLDQVLQRITIHYIPKKEEIAKQLKDLAEHAPMLFLIPKELQDDEGRPVAKVGSLEEDLDGNIVIHISQEMSMSGVFLRRVIEVSIKKHEDFEKSLVDYIFTSPVFERDRRPILELGISEYLKGNYLTTVHLLIPQVEAAIRTLYEKIGGSVLKLARDGAFYLKTLNELLRDEKIVAFLGEDMSLYFRVLLTDQRGWNLRNNICHGLVGANGSWQSSADRVLHVLLCLAVIREKAQD